jgi:hypothetical protein
MFYSTSYLTECAEENGERVPSDELPADIQKEYFPNKQQPYKLERKYWGKPKLVTIRTEQKKSNKILLFSLRKKIHIRI